MIRTRWALATLLATCLVGACSDDEPKPDIADPTSSASASSSSATVSPSPTVSATPALGPEDTVRAWVDDWNVALHTGDTSTVRAHDAEPCRGCDELIGPVEEIAEAGGTFTGGDWKVAGLSVVSASDVDAKVNLGVNVAAGSTVASAGAQPTTYPATKHLLRFALVNDGERWLVAVIEVVS